MKSSRNMVSRLMAVCSIALVVLAALPAAGHAKNGNGPGSNAGGNGPRRVAAALVAQRYSTIPGLATQVSTPFLTGNVVDATTGVGLAVGTIVVEPPGGDNTCATAQDLGRIPASDNFTSYLAPNDIDFYKFTGVPGAQFTVQVDTFSSPYLYVRNLAWFSSACQLIQATGPVYYGLPQLKITVPADGVVILAITGDPDPNYTGDHSNYGNYTILGLAAEAPDSVLIGRVVDGTTGVGLAGNAPPYVGVSLEQCFWYGCSWIASTQTDGQGNFTLQGAYSGDLRVRVSSSNAYVQPVYAPKDGATVTIARGQRYDFGVIQLMPLVRVKAITGLLVDAATSQSLAGGSVPFAYAELQRGNPYGGYDTIAIAYADNTGRYVFQAGNSGLLLPGNYQVIGHADQYQEMNNSVLALGVLGGETREVSPLRLTSNPVRFTDVTPCDPIPAGGGKCAFSFRLVNGTTADLHGKSWEIVTGTSIGGFTNGTMFEVGREGGNLLAKGGSQLVKSEFTVPGNVAAGASFCVTARYGEDPGSSVYDVEGAMELFCLEKGTNGQTTLMPVAKARHMNDPR